MIVLFVQIIALKFKKTLPPCANLISLRVFLNKNIDFKDIVPVKLKGGGAMGFLGHVTTI